MCVATSVDNYKMCQRGSDRVCVNCGHNCLIECKKTQFSDYDDERNNFHMVFRSVVKTIKINSDL